METTGFQSSRSKLPCRLRAPGLETTATGRYRDLRAGSGDPDTALFDLWLVFSGHQDIERFRRA